MALSVACGEDGHPGAPGCVLDDTQSLRHPVRMSFRAIFLLFVVSGCGTHYQLEITTEGPDRLPPGIHSLDASACPAQRWRTVYDWRTRATKPQQKRTAARIISRCIDPETVAERDRVKLDGEAKLELTGTVGSTPPDSEMLDVFTFERKSGVVVIREAGGRARTIEHVGSIEYYRNAVIIRVADGAGFIVSPDSMLGVHWNAEPPK